MQLVFDKIAAAKHLVLIGMLMIEQVFICFGSVTKMLVVSVCRRTKLNKADNAKSIVGSVCLSVANTRRLLQQVVCPCSKRQIYRPIS